MIPSRHDFEALTDKSWLSSDNLFDASLLQDLCQEITRHELSGLMNPASTGRLAEKSVGNLRGDSILWLDDANCGDASGKFLDALGGLRKKLNEFLFLGLESVEAHYAVYPAGASYARHRDRFRDDDARVLSLVCYLNSDWPDSAGGALRLYLPDGDHDIAPRLGTSVIFLSEEIEHEVLPSTQTRYSIAAWFRQHEIQLR